MKKSITSKWITWLALGGIGFAIYLVSNEILTPGYCPPYPLLGWPACYLVLFYFILVYTGSRFVKGSLARILQLAGTIAGLGTASWFSINQWLGYEQCPVLFKVPLCYAALITFLTLLLLELLKKK